MPISFLNVKQRNIYSISIIVLVFFSYFKFKKDLKINIKKKINKKSELIHNTNIQNLKNNIKKRFNVSFDESKLITLIQDENLLNKEYHKPNKKSYAFYFLNKEKSLKLICFLKHKNILITSFISITSNYKTIFKNYMVFSFCDNKFRNISYEMYKNLK